MRVRTSRAQALVEAALVVPLLLLVAFGGIGVGRLVQARMALSAATREAARATALAPMPSAGSHSEQPRREAEQAGAAEGERVARGYGLTDARVEVRADPFEPGGWVTASALYTVNEKDLPLIRAVFAPLFQGRGIVLQAEHIERIDRYRSLAAP
jgi:TadE-like protein